MIDELKVVDERPFTVKNEWFRIRHYNDQTWEILDADGIPVIQGKCGQTVEQDFEDLRKRK